LTHDHRTAAGALALAKELSRVADRVRKERGAAGVLIITVHRPTNDHSEAVVASGESRAEDLPLAVLADVAGTVVARMIIKVVQDETETKH